MKKTLSFSLWDEPPVLIDMLINKKSFFERALVMLLSRLFRFDNLQVVRLIKPDRQQRIEGKIWPSYAHTMIGLKRLDNIQFCVESVLKDNIKGDFIETGVWRGGACIFMRAVLAAYGIKERRVIVADSFEGLPKPDVNKYHNDAEDRHHIHRFLAVSLEQVQNNFRLYDLLDEQVVFLKGWFKDTLRDLPTDRLSILRLDGDMYGSTWDALTNLYPKLSEGGYCIIDDYALKSCRQAVDDFRSKHNITNPIIQVDWTGIYWRKD